MQFQTGVREPIRHVRHGLEVVVIEMGARREQFDRVESMRSDMHEVLSCEPGLMKEMGRYTEAVASQTTSL